MPPPFRPCYVYIALQARRQPLPVTGRREVGMLSAEGRQNDAAAVADAPRRRAASPLLPVSLLSLPMSPRHITRRRQPRRLLRSSVAATRHASSRQRMPMSSAPAANTSTAAPTLKTSAPPPRSFAADHVVACRYLSTRLIAHPPPRHGLPAACHARRRQSRGRQVRCYI
jgi:hypothetical protein